MPDVVSELCAELADLYRALGEAIAPPRPYAGAGPVEDPSLAAPILAATLTGTAPRYSIRRRVPTSGSPLDLELLGAQEGIEAVSVDLATQAREALGDITREHGPERALEVLPMLYGRLEAGGPLARRMPAVLDALRRRARYALDLDRRPLPLGHACPSVQDDYLATWAGGFTPAAEWVDGVCRTYDVVASVRATRVRAELAGCEVEPVEVWVRSMLVVRDPDAPAGSDGAAPWCPGCGRSWRTAAEFRQLYALLHAEDDVEGAAEAVRGVLYGRLAAAMRAVVDSAGCRTDSVSRA